MSVEFEPERVHPNIIEKAVTNLGFGLELISFEKENLKTSISEPIKVSGKFTKLCWS